MSNDCSNLSVPNRSIREYDNDILEHNVSLLLDLFLRNDVLKVEHPNIQRREKVLLCGSQADVGVLDETCSVIEDDNNMFSNNRH